MPNTRLWKSTRKPQIGARLRRHAKYEYRERGARRFCREPRSRPASDLKQADYLVQNLSGPSVSTMHGLAYRPRPPLVGSRSCLSSASFGQACSVRQHYRSKRGLRPVCADSDSDDSKSGLDKAWSDFVASREKYTEPNPQNNPSNQRSSSPRFSSNRPSGPGRDQVAKQETELLDFFSQESFFAVGGGVVVLLLVTFLLLGA